MTWPFLDCPICGNCRWRSRFKHGICQTCYDRVTDWLDGLDWTVTRPKEETYG